MKIYLCINLSLDTNFFCVAALYLFRNTLHAINAANDAVFHSFVFKVVARIQSCI